jgi:hypothetical protein
MAVKKQFTNTNVYKKNKYSNKKVIIDNIKFDSKREAARYKQLIILESSGKIVDLELQPKYILQESFKYNDQTIRAITYSADFRYIDVSSGQLIVEDVKGMKTDVYKLKKKLFLKKYGNDLIFYEM